VNVPRRDGARKPFKFSRTKKSSASTGGNYNESDPWGDKNSNISPKTVRGNKPADQVERERKTAMNAELASRPKAKTIPEKVAPSYRNDID
jgi:hypothetical protein